MLKGTKALVTGGSRGIGFAIARALYKNGCKVVITGQNEQTLKSAAESIGDGVLTLVWDVSDLELADAKINEAADLMGGLDIVVNNAGIFAQRSEWGKDSLLQTTVNEWESVMRTKTSSIFFTRPSARRLRLA